MTAVDQRSATDPVSRAVLEERYRILTAMRALEPTLARDHDPVAVASVLSRLSRAVTDSDVRALEAGESAHLPRHAKAEDDGLGEFDLMPGAAAPPVPMILPPGGGAQVVPPLRPATASTPPPAPLCPALVETTSGSAPDSRRGRFRRGNR